MSNKQYTQDQIAELMQNPYVLKCSTKSISYSYECKEKILYLYEKEGCSAREAFTSLGFPHYIVYTTLPKNCVKAWRKIVAERGYTGLKEGGRGRKKREMLSQGNQGTSPPIVETVEYLQAKIAYLEAENKVFRLIRAGKYK